MELLSPDIGIILWSLLALLNIILFIAALLSIKKSTFADSTTNLLWVLIVLFAPLVGSILYFAIGKPKQRSKQL